MSPKRPSKSLLYLSTLPLLTHLLASITSSTQLLTTEDSPILNQTKLTWLLASTILLSLPSSLSQVWKARYDRLLLFFLVPFITAALSMGVLLAMFRLSFPLDNSFVKGLIAASSLFVSAGSLVWLLACGIWLWLTEFDTETG